MYIRFLQSKKIRRALLIIVLVVAGIALLVSSGRPTQSPQQPAEHVVNKEPVYWNGVVPGEDTLSKVTEALDTPFNDNILNVEGLNEYNYGSTEKFGKVYVWADDTGTALVVKTLYGLDPNKNVLDEKIPLLSPDVTLYTRCDNALTIDIYSEEGFATEGFGTLGEHISIFYFKPGDASKLIKILSDSHSRTPYPPGSCEAY